MSDGATIEFDKDAVAARIRKAGARGIKAVSTQFLKDANYYVRFDSGTMRDSSLIASDLENGDIIWDTPYARKVYYTGTPSFDTNPNASLMWAEKAAKEHGSEYEEMFQKSIDEGV